MRSIFTTALLSTAALAFSNSTPVYGTYPGWVNGKGRVGITVEIFLDLTCSDCQAENPTWNELLDTEWLDGTVRDQVYWAYNPIPLPYHVHGFQVAQVVPYLQALCAEEGNCLLNEYKDFCYDQLSTVLSMTDVSDLGFEAWWSE